MRGRKARTTAAVAALLVLSGAAVVPTATAAGRPTAKRPDSGVAQLRAEVARTAERLAAGTVAWERGQVQLGVQVQRKVAAERALQELQGQTATARHQVSSFANSLYRNPVNPILSATLAGDPRLMTDLMYLRRRTNQDAASVQASTQLLLQRTAQVQSLLVAQESATRAVTRLQAQLEQRLAALQADEADAAAGQMRLQRALDELRAREAAWAASLSVSGGATCGGGVPADAVNGFLPPGALCWLTAAQGHRLIAPAARAFDAMSAAFTANRGERLCITDSYRDYAVQVDVFSRKPSLAATPGRSQHGLGLAVDLCGGIQRYGSPAYHWMKSRAAQYGFVHPEWAEPDGSRPEPWHWEFRGRRRSRAPTDAAHDGSPARRAPRTWHPEQPTATWRCPARSAGTATATPQGW